MIGRMVEQALEHTNAPLLRLLSGEQVIGRPGQIFSDKSI